MVNPSRHCLNCGSLSANFELDNSEGKLKDVNHLNFPVCGVNRAGHVTQDDRFARGLWGKGRGKVATGEGGQGSKQEYDHALPLSPRKCVFHGGLLSPVVFLQSHQNDRALRSTVKMSTQQVNVRMLMASGNCIYNDVILDTWGRVWRWHAITYKKVPWHCNVLLF